MKVYTTVPGLEVRIDRYGLATETSPAEVPTAVGEELKKDARLRVVQDEPPARAPRLAERAPTKAKKGEEG